jgi:hypothetical protein
MRAELDPFSFLIFSIAGWINQNQQRVIEYLVEENRVLREQIGNRRMRFTNDQRRRLAARAKKLSRESVSAGRDDRHTPDTVSLASKPDCPGSFKQSAENVNAYISPSIKRLGDLR